MLRRRLLLLFAAVALASCARPATPPPAKPASPSEICVAVMRRTRACADAFVPGLLALRVRLDRPSGIAARFAAEGREALLTLARAQFANDWSEEAIATNCAQLAAKPPAEQERIVTPDRECVSRPDCETFTACDLAHKEARWTAQPPSPQR